MKKHLRIIVACSIAAAVISMLVAVRFLTEAKSPYRARVETTDETANEEPGTLLSVIALEDGAGWRISAPDASVWLTVDRSGVVDRPDEYVWWLDFGFDMTPFFNAGLDRVWWNCGGFSFDPGMAMASSRARLYEEPGTDRCILNTQFYCDGDPARDESLGAVLRAMRNYDSEPAMRPVSPGVYQMEVTHAYEYICVRWAEDGSEVSFILRASDYSEGRADPEKIADWAYDPEAGTLTKRFAAG